MSLVLASRDSSRTNVLFADMPGESEERAQEADGSLNDSVERLQRELSALLKSSPSNPKRISRPATRSPLKPLDTNACSPANTLRSPPRPANTPPVCDVVTSSQTETLSSHKQPRQAAFDPRASERARQKSDDMLEHAHQTSNQQLQQGAANVYEEILHDTACVSTSGCNTPTTTSTGAQGLSLRAPSVTPRCAERQSLAFCLAPAEPLAGLEETRQMWEREKIELSECIARSVKPTVTVTALFVHGFRACSGTLRSFFVADSIAVFEQRTQPAGGKQQRAPGTFVGDCGTERGAGSTG